MRYSRPKKTVLDPLGPRLSVFKGSEFSVEFLGFIDERVSVVISGLRLKGFGNT